MAQPLPGATFVSLGTAEEQSPERGAHIATSLSGFPSPQLTPLIHKASCLINLSKWNHQKILFQIQLNTQHIKCIPRLPQSFRVNQNR